jgi:SSS family solute:Na+ symporter
MFAGYLKLLPVFIFVIPGVVAHLLAKQGAIDLATPDAALPTLITALLPAGVRGLVVAGLLAALMSSLSSVYNSASTLVTWDIYKKLRPDAPEAKLIRVGQLTTVVLVVLGLAWTQYMKLISEQLFTYLQSVQAYISPPIAAVFLLGIFFKRLNSQGATASLAVGFVLGMVRLVAEMTKVDHLLATANFLHYAIFIFVVCAAVLVVVSLLTPAPDEAKLEGLTYGTTERTPTKRSDLMLAAGLLVGVLATWLYFS